MTKNMGTTDRIARVVIAAIFAILIFAKVVTGVMVIILGVLAAILVVTSYIAFCPLYVPFKISTNDKK